MNDHLEITSHARSVVVTTICGLTGIGGDDFGVTDTLSVALLPFAPRLNSDSVLETPDVSLVV